MDQQLLDMLNRMADKNDTDHAQILSALQTHIKEDMKYWKKIDVQEGQLSLMRRGVYWLMGIVGVGAGWLGLK